MSERFQDLHFPEPPSWNCVKLSRFAERLITEGIGVELPDLPEVKYPPKTIGQILKAIEEGRHKEVNLLEWINIIQEKSQWDREHKQQAKETSQRIWEIAKQSDHLLKILLWRLCFFYSFPSGKSWIAESLVECFEEFAGQRKLKTRLPVKVVSALTKEERVSLISKFSLSILKTPGQLFRDAGLPTTLPITKDSLGSTVFEITPRPKKEDHVTWFLECVKEMSKDQKIGAAIHLLEKMPKETGLKHKSLVEWLRGDFGPRAPGSMWDSLSATARKKLREWVGGANYRDFERLVDLVLKKSFNVPLENWQKKQLESRRDFWRNYSDRFERIRILLPSFTMQILGKNIYDLNTKDIDQLLDDGSTETEVCIFDFGELFVVEFFRGPGSETRMFQKTPRLEEVFFGDSDLSIKRIRSLGGEKHDHRYLWQYFCEKELRSKEIFPNENTVKFVGLPEEIAAYDPLEGLLRPTSDQIEERERKLVDWKTEIAILEWEAALYMNGKNEYIDSLSRSIASSLVKNNFVNTTNTRFLEEKIKDCIEEIAAGEPYEIRWLMRRHMNLTKHPHFVSIHVTEFVTRRLWEYDHIQDVYGTDIDIYACIDKEVQGYRAL